MQCFMAAWCRGVSWRRMVTCICMAESLHGLPETINFVNQLYLNTNAVLKRNDSFSFTNYYVWHYNSRCIITHYCPIEFITPRVNSSVNYGFVW